MMNKLGNTILKDLGKYVKEIKFKSREPLEIEYLPLKQTVEFINGQGFLYNFLKEEFLDKVHNNYKWIYLNVNFETNKIIVIKTNEIKKYKIDNEKLYEQLKEIIG
jgi:hypothetical protein